MRRGRFLQTVALAAVAVCALSICRAADKSRPNVLFIPVDDLNAWVGYTGRNKQARTPNIDRLSEMGVSFSQAYCCAPACEPTRASLMSGLRPSSTGCYLNGHLWKKYVPEGISLNATFKKNGYYVAGMGKLYHSGASQGLAGVYASEWDEYPKMRVPSTGGAQKYEGFHVPMPHDIKDTGMGDWHTIDYCIEQLQKKHDKPFFLSCGLVKPHLPWAVPRKYYEMFPRDKIELPPHMKDDLKDIPAAGIKMAKPEGDHAKFLKSGRWKDAVQSYLATCAFADVCIGRLLDALEKSAYKDNTIIVLWGDHGWHLGEKEHWRKFALWEEATRAPLIWVAPGVTKAGKVCKRPVDFLCVYPTLCDLAGIKVPDHVEGKSIRKLLENPDADWDGVAITTHGHMNHAIRSERWRYIRYADGSEELYDHSKDPYEWKNLASDPKFGEIKKYHAAHLPKKNVEQKAKAHGKSSGKKVKKRK